MELIKKAIIIDGNSLIYRLFYASYNQLEYYKLHNLKPGNAVKLFLITLFKLLGENKYSYGLIAFDAHKKNMRHDEYEEYKANRKPMPVELVEQLPVIKKCCEYFGINQMCMDGFEADDLIGSFVKNMNNNDIFVDVFTSDKDMLQLVNNKTEVKLLKTGISEILSVNVENFFQLYSLKPYQIPDFKGISGDSSDNLKGIKGIGPKTAIELINKYDSLENIYNHLDELSEGSRNKFLEYKDNAILCKKMAIINTTPLDNGFLDSNYLIKPKKNEELKEIIKEYNFSGLDKYL
jgi:DNA polymerase-1